MRKPTRARPTSNFRPRTSTPTFTPHSTAPSTAKAALAALKSLADPKRAASHQRYFKTGKGEYGEGDNFLGLTVPQTRALAKTHRAMPLVEIVKLLRDRHHEARLLALLILVDQFEKADQPSRKSIFDAYMANRKFINNWDLVDTSARDIVGGHLLERPHRPLFELAASKAWNDRRIAIIASHRFILAGRFDTTLALAEQLLEDEHDLIHKAVGWMLREMGNRDVKPLHDFLDRHASVMPRTMLRYAIEKLSEKDRRNYMDRRAVAGKRAALNEQIAQRRH